MDSLVSSIIILGIKSSIIWLCKTTFHYQASCFLNYCQVFSCSHPDVSLKIQGAYKDAKEFVPLAQRKKRKKSDTFSNVMSLSRNHDSVTQDNPENLLNQFHVRTTVF